MPSFSIRVAGAFYYRPAVLKCKLGDVVTLVHEPDNEHDYNAVAIMHAAGKIGYIPRDAAPEYRDYVNTRRIVESFVEKIESLQDVHIVVRLKEPKLTFRDVLRRIFS